jgi:sRNA-binding carbon storage regulator CsrA
MLNIKLKPGQRICIGGDIVIDVVLDSGRKLALSIDAPQDHPIVRHESKQVKATPEKQKHNL